MACSRTRLGSPVKTPAAMMTINIEMIRKGVFLICCFLVNFAGIVLVFPEQLLKSLGWTQESPKATFFILKHIIGI